MDSPLDELFRALQNSDHDAAQEILRKHPEAVNARHPTGPSVLMTAIYMGDTDFVRLMLEHGGICDIWTAAALGDTVRLEAAIDDIGGAASTLSPDGWTPLHLAAHFGKAEACALLIASGANIHAWSTNGLRNQPLHAAVAGGNEEVVGVLLEAGADVNAVQHGGFTPLHGAAQHGAVEIVMRLLDQGADVSATTDEGHDAAALAAMHGHARVAEYLRSKRD